MAGTVVNNGKGLGVKPMNLLPPLIFSDLVGKPRQAPIGPILRPVHRPGHQHPDTPGGQEEAGLEGFNNLTVDLGLM